MARGFSVCAIADAAFLREMFGAALLKDRVAIL
jgi:hypothetical protein